MSALVARQVLVVCDGCGNGQDWPVDDSTIPGARATAKAMGWSYTRRDGDRCPDCRVLGDPGATP